MSSQQTLSSRSSTSSQRDSGLPVYVYYPFLPLCCNDAEMKEAAAKICKDFLNGAWKTVSSDDLVFRRISGGLSNFLYYVGLPETTDPSRKVSPATSPKTNEGASDTSQNGDDKKLTFKKILGEPFNRQTSFTLKEPNKVLIRIYGQSERCVDNIILDSVIFTLLSERKLGPKLHGVFSGGRIEEYIPARQLLTKELSEPAFSMKIAEKMAAIHSMNVPLCKEPQWLWNKINKWLQSSLEILENPDSMNKKDAELIKKLKQHKLDKEVKWLRDYLQTVDSPVVFCHNDLQEGNILLREDLLPQNDETNDDVNVDYSNINHENSLDSFPNDGYTTGNNTSSNGKTLGQINGSKSKTVKPVINTMTPGNRGKRHHRNSFTLDMDCNSTDSSSSNISDGIGEPKLVLIDYEYCSYNHRGFDIANHFIEWVYDYTNPEHPYYYEKLDQYPTLEQKEIFMKQYLMKINGDEMVNVDEINQLNSEVESYSLASHLFWCLWAIMNAKDSKIPFGYLEYAVSRLDYYYRVKQELIKNEPSNPLKRKIREADI